MAKDVREGWGKGWILPVPGWSRSSPQQGFTLPQSRASTCLGPQVLPLLPSVHPVLVQPKAREVPSLRQHCRIAVDGANPRVMGTKGLDPSGSISQANTPLPRVGLSSMDLSSRHFSFITPHGPSCPKVPGSLVVMSLL